MCESVQICTGRHAERCSLVLQDQSSILDLVGGQEGENKHTQSADVRACFTESHLTALVWLFLNFLKTDSAPLSHMTQIHNNEE